MSKNPSLPTKSELYNQSKVKEDFITLNIYNPPKETDEDSIYDNNRTEANLNVGDNCDINKKNDYIDDLRKKAKYLDNTRENPYPLSENRGVNQPPPPAINNNKNIYSKSQNPYFQDKINNNKYNLNNVPISTENEFKKENNNVEIIKYPNYIGNKMPKKKMKKICRCTKDELCILCCLILIFWPFALCYGVHLLNKKDKEEK